LKNTINNNQMSKLSKETIDRIKVEAEQYAGVMVWINKHPKGEEQLFYEYISATSHIAGATEWAGKAQPVIKRLTGYSKWQSAATTNCTTSPRQIQGGR
jgi:hypothetical protein